MADAERGNRTIQRARENCVLVAIAARERRDMEVMEHDRHDGDRTQSVDIGAVF